MGTLLVAIKAIGLGEGEPADGAFEPRETRLDPINAQTVAWAVDTAAARGWTVTAVAVGGPAADTALRSAVARGCETAVRLELGADPDVASVAAALARAAQEVDAELIVMGVESYDAAGGMLAAATAAALGWSAATAVRGVRLDGDAIEAFRAAGNADEDVRRPLPAVISLADSGAPPPHPPLAAAVKSRRAVIEVRDAGSLATSLRPWTGGVTQVRPLPPRAVEPRRLPVDEAVREVLALHAGAGA